MPENTANPNIKHVFVLMLENRSYDHMLGFFKDDISRYSNSYKGIPYNAAMRAKEIMPYDPKHNFDHVMEQLCGREAMMSYTGKGIYPRINNSGFVSDYARIVEKHQGIGNVGEIMNCYDTAFRLPGN